ncbi:carbohydrate ABC transporter permease [Paenibacillus eucommiae]|uniref:Aldouronate transport system permease protein n=1 Tax=Paenibacillus eucommiae TaxID=1355755 RepID=A0ABS4IPF5_9BACL|nr:carbohydrate ABC transporter permease [Paenibacillus eucommiae]MBP1989452.1 putative aldouronate transport system permease protein [Paenibacillus eucommiae]
MVKKMQVGEMTFQLLNAIFLTAFALLTVIPFWHVFVVSITSYESYLNNRFILFPRDISFSSYVTILSDEAIHRSFLLTVGIVIVSTFLHLLITAITAFPLSRYYLKGRNVFLLFIIITMLFSGGLIPNYLLIKNLGLINNVLVFIIPGMFVGFNTILMLNFFKQIPESLEEAARIDGAGHMYTLFKIFIPLSMPIMATLALFYGVGKWNDWFTALIFIDQAKLFPIQNILREFLILGNMDSIRNGAVQGDPLKLIVSNKMAIVVVATLPIMLVYPFLQKHFVKGVLLGSIKQ